MSRFFSFVDETSWAVDHSLDYIKENLRRASKESIAIIKPRENKVGNESFGSFQRKIIGLNLSPWSPDKPVDRVCSPVPSVRARCQKWHRNYELHWKRRCHSDPHVQKKEDQFQEQGRWEDRNAGFNGPRESESFGRRIRFVQFSVIRKHMMRHRSRGDWLHQKEAECTEWRELVLRRNPRVRSEGKDSISFTVTTCVLSCR